MNEELRNGLWNVVTTHFFQTKYLKRAHQMIPEPVATGPLESAVQAIWTDLFKLPLDTRGQYWADQYKQIRDHFMTSTWNRVYEFVEFMPNHWSSDHPWDAAGFISATNTILTRELSAYRFVGTTLLRITDEQEISAIEEATRLPDSVAVVSKHIDAAIRLLADRKTPDYRNSIKESISAVESFCSLLARQDKANLATALATLEGQTALHPALKKAFSALYGYSSDANGIRHALMDEHDLTFDDAKFMLVACSAFVNYLRGTASRTGLLLS